MPPPPPTVEEPGQLTILFYALPQFAIAYITLAIVNYTPAFYASEVGIPVLTISGLMLLSRGLDVVTDPLIGILSDRTQSRLGRRKPWILAGTPMLLLGSWLLFMPGDDVGPGYFLLAISLLFMGLTMIQLPYIAWGAELSFNYDKRTQITSLRERVGAVGSIGALSTAFVVSLLGFEQLRPVLEVMTWIIFLLLPALVITAVMKVPPGEEHRGEHPPFFKGAIFVFRNRSFRLLACTVFLLYIGIAPGGALSWFLFDNYLDAPNLFAPSLLLEFIASFLGLPLWTALAVKTSKHRAISLALLWMALFTALIPLAASLGAWGVMAVVGIRSFALGALLMLPMAIIADVIDLDTAETGTQRAGIYIAFSGIIVKLAITIGVSTALAIPGFFGFDPAAAENSKSALSAVLATIAWMPALLFLAAAPLFWRFPLGREQVIATQARIH